ncbi:metallophosphoesterase family protein [Periweissella fabalis]|uniref:Metallophosphoesterase n=1 Tax=Periweissella fabalis TaxID=1070421 RepID=A0A7X6S2D5_9LACO|nr:metallophosphoesterase [Periweissella fabalis]MCM0599580.1 metallophosphoesterase [Periweissella fabalis]NKZ23885.1 metallophosphoesterase [Periweissella fabalis]
MKKIIQISDLHLTSEGQPDAYNQKTSPYTKLELIFNDIALKYPDVEFIAITGDLVHEGVAADYKVLNDIINTQKAKLGIDIHVILGNHDRTAAFFKGYLKQAAKDEYYYVINDGTTKYFFLDTKYDDKEQGSLSTEQLTWLADEVNADVNIPKILFTHHPIYGLSIIHRNDSLISNSARLYEIIANKNVLGILSGHLHFTSTNYYNHILSVTADSSAYHIDLTNPRYASFTDAVSYNVISFDEQHLGVENVYLRYDNEIRLQYDFVANTFTTPTV